MTAGIMENDRGFVMGTTWHGLPQYETVDRPITIQEAETVLDYPLIKVPLYRYNKEGIITPVESFAIVRDDTDKVLYNKAGDRFTVENNVSMLRRIDEFILANYKDLFIESVGTLFNGQTAFINLRAETHQVKGDKSPTETNLMYSNPIGMGSHLAYAHSTRVVCYNTFRISKLQGEMNKTLRKFSHTKNAGQKITDYLIDLSAVFLGLTEYKETLNMLAMQSISRDDVSAFLDRFFSLKDRKGEDKKVRGQTIAKKARETFLEVFEKQADSMENDTLYSKYGLFQAYTDYIDHHGRSREDTDDASIRWDGMTGQRAKSKDQAFEYLVSVN